MAKFAKDLGLEQVVIIAMDDEFGHGLRDVFTQQYESRFGTLDLTNPNAPAGAAER